MNVDFPYKKRNFYSVFRASAVFAVKKKKNQLKVTQ